MNAKMEEVKTSSSSVMTPKPVKNFSELALDPRVDRAIENAVWRNPNTTHATVVPVIMHGLVVLVSAPTGSGRTAIYDIHIVHQI